MATHSSILAWRIPWTEELGGHEFAKSRTRLRDFIHSLSHDGVIIHLKPDILECEVKWTLESNTMNKASGGDGIPVELFQILKNDAVKVLHSIWQQIWKMHQWRHNWKGSVFIPILKKGNAKECSNYFTIALISHASKVMFKFYKPGFSNKWTMNFQIDVQVGFRKGRGTRNQIANIRWIIKKAIEFQKNIFLVYWLCQNRWLCGSQ